MACVSEGSSGCQANDRELIDRILAGDRELFSIFVRRHSQTLFRIAVSILRDATEAEDVVQDAFVSAYQHLRQYSGRAAFLTWLGRIAANGALQKISRRKRQPSFAELDSEEVVPLRSNLPNPEQAALAAEHNAMLHEAITQLGETHRTILALRDLAEMDTASTAKHLGITQENVKVRLLRARRALRAQLDRDAVLAPISLSHASSPLVSRIPNRAR